MEFSYYFHYCKNLKFEDRPDYSTLKSLFYDLLMGQVNISSTTEFIFDWFYDETPFNENRNEEENPQNQTFAGLFRNNKQSTFSPNDVKSDNIPELSNENVGEQTPSPDKNKNSRKKDNLFNEEDYSQDEIILKSKKMNHSSNSESSDDDTERLDEDKQNNENDIKKIIINNSDSNKNNSDSNYNLFPKSSSEKSSENQKLRENSDKDKPNLEDIIIRNSNPGSNDINDNQNEINLIIKKGKNKN